MGQFRKQSAVVKSGTETILKENDSEDPDSFARVLKPLLMEAIQDLLDDLETVYENIARNAKDHIHSELAFVHLRISYVEIDCLPSEIVLTIGHSKTVETFLKSAAHYRNYTVIVAETGPS